MVFKYCQIIFYTGYLKIISFYKQHLINNNHVCFSIWTDNIDLSTILFLVLPFSYIIKKTKTFIYFISKLFVFIKISKLKLNE